jgi:hypothetical protein
MVAERKIAVANDSMSQRAADFMVFATITL